MEEIMKFTAYDLQIESNTYRLFDVIDVPRQLRVVYPQGDTPIILANAMGFDFLESIFKIVSASMKDNCLIRIKDNAKAVERFHDWYPSSAEFHLDMIIYNYQYTQISSKKIMRLLKMLDYSKKECVDIAVPDITYNNNKWWKLKGTLNVDKRSNFLTISSNSYGFLYMADEASSYHDIEDDEKEMFAHSHLFGLCKYEDLLDMRYYYEEN